MYICVHTTYYISKGKGRESGKMLHCSISRMTLFKKTIQIVPVGEVDPILAPIHAGWLCMHEAITILLNSSHPECLVVHLGLRTNEHLTCLVLIYEYIYTSIYIYG